MSMKPLLPYGLAALLFLPLSLFAQSQPAPPCTSGGQAQAPHGTVGQKTAVAASRLIAYSHYTGNVSGNFLPADSQNYVYPADTVGLYSEDNLYSFSGSTAVPTYKYSYTYDASGYLTRVLLQAWNTSSHTYSNYFRYTMTNNPAGFQTAQLVEAWNASAGMYINNSLYTYTLNSANQKTDELVQAWAYNLGMWLNSTHTTYMLNAQGSVTQQIYQTWNSSGAGSWKNVNRSDFSYDATGLIVMDQKDMTWNVNTLAWTNTNRQVYTLNASMKPYLRMEQKWNASSVSWDNNVRDSFIYDASGNIVLTYYDSYNASSGTYSPIYELIQTFNSFNQLTSSTKIAWTLANTYAIDGSAIRYNYYYEAYNTTHTAGVGTIAAHNAELSLSPVPAGNTLSISLKWQPAQALTVTVTDMAGRVYLSFAAPASKSFNTSLSVADMPSGNYLLRIKGNSGGSAAQMITVVH